MGTITVQNEEEFRRLLEDISMEASRAVDPWRLLKGLDPMRDHHLRELNYSIAFWRVIFRSLYDASLAHLGRLYDTHPQSISLGNFLQTVKKNPSYFSKSAFHARLQNRPDAVHRPLDVQEIDGEIRSVSGTDQLVRRLHNVRNNRIAHRPALLVHSSGAHME